MGSLEKKGRESGGRRKDKEIYEWAEALGGQHHLSEEMTTDV